MCFNEALLTETDLKEILNESNIHYESIVSTKITNASNDVIGYLGEHLKLNIQLKVMGRIVDHRFFVKCIPRNDKWKADYIRKCNFFQKEYCILGQVFKNADGDKGESKWRPKILLLKEELFVFEDLVEQGFVTPPQEYNINYEETKAVITSLAKFHATSVIYEQKKQNELGRPYTLWEDFKNVLQEPREGSKWRNTGMRAAIESIKVYSKYKNNAAVMAKCDEIIPKLYELTWSLMEPTEEYTNVIIHRDLWTNNIFLKQNSDGTYHANIIDFQTVLYCPPAADIACFLCFNTNRDFRNDRLNDVLSLYYSVFCAKIKGEPTPLECTMTKEELVESYKRYILFGLTQAALIIPLVVMDSESRKALFSNPETYCKVNEVDRSQEILTLAKNNKNYRQRIMDILDEIVERFVIKQNM